MVEKSCLDRSKVCLFFRSEFFSSSSATDSIHDITTLPNLGHTSSANLKVKDESWIISLVYKWNLLCTEIKWNSFLLHNVVWFS